jgi:hypothetical protein
MPDDPRRVKRGAEWAGCSGDTPATFRLLPPLPPATFCLSVLPLLLAFGGLLLSNCAEKVGRQECAWDKEFVAEAVELVLAVSRFPELPDV